MASNRFKYTSLLNYLMLPFITRAITRWGQITLPKQYLDKIGAAECSSFKIIVEPSRKRILLDLIE
jgi:bifunctional DNA-binding transcriptional regulator/antitoxin component of YhaV-PrlF toxin-antitoxin module